MIAAVLAWLRGRGRRREYWLGLMVAVALIAASYPAASPASELALWLAAFGLWLVLSLRRLRDIGWRTWLLLAPLAPLVVAVVLVITSDEDTLYLNFIAGLLMLCAGLVWAILLVVVGAWKSRHAGPPSAEQQAEVFG
ncbi:hypothetical protein AS593_20075 [Caulobacter vibrioides]|nr:hypothetical protein AS593_20075 [Caulobacter vibrioides]